MERTLHISYKIFLEAEDISQSRILSCASFVKSLLKDHSNAYISCADIDDESDPEDFTVRLYVNEEIREDEAQDTVQAEMFLDHMADVLAEIAHMHSFLDMEGEMQIEFEGERLSYSFRSKSGDAVCNFTENKN